MAERLPRRVLVGLAALLLAGCAAVQEPATTSLSDLLPRPGATWNEPMRLTARAAGVSEGDYHPETGRLAFISGTKGGAHLWLQEDAPLGIEPPQLLVPHSARDRWPRFSPEGHRLAFVSCRQDAAGDLWLLELERQPGPVMQILSGGGLLPVGVRGGELRKLTDSASADDQPCWHPRGKKRYFASHDITKVYFGNIAGNRFMWRIEFLKPIDKDQLSFIIYLDADNKNETGRKKVGCEFMLTPTGTTVYSPDG